MTIAEIQPSETDQLYRGCFSKDLADNRHEFVTSSVLSFNVERDEENLENRFY